MEKVVEFIKEDDYEVVYDPAAKEICWSGAGRLPEVGYRPVFKLLEKAVGARSAELTIDLRGLIFLNSSGINVLSRFLLQLRNSQTCKITIQANQEYPWQRKALPTMHRLMRGMKVDLFWR